MLETPSFVISILLYCTYFQLIVKFLLIFVTVKNLNYSNIYVQRNNLYNLIEEFLYCILHY